jgi:hypothetical protein
MPTPAPVIRGQIPENAPAPRSPRRVLGRPAGQTWGEPTGFDCWIAGASQPAQLRVWTDGDGFKLDAYDRAGGYRAMLYPSDRREIDGLQPKPAGEFWAPGDILRFERKAGALAYAARIGFPYP